MCSDSLITLRLGCPECGTELSGHFDTCRYCRLDAGDSELLEVFLRSRGNIRDVQAHLAVSYPTARARLGELLDRLGLSDPLPEAAAVTASQPGAPAVGAPAAGAPTEQVLDDLAAGRIGVAQAEALLTGRTPPPS